MLATVAKIRASCFERLLSQRGFPLLYGIVSGKLLCYGSKCERDAPLLGITDQHSDVEAESGWQHKDVARLLFAFLAEQKWSQMRDGNRTPAQAEITEISAHSHSQSHTLSCALCYHTSIHPHTSWSRPAIPSNVASWLESRAFCGSRTRVDMDAVFKL